MPVAASSAAAAPAPAATNTTGKIYSNDEPSPLDPPSGQDQDQYDCDCPWRTETRVARRELGVINTIRNRAVDGSYGGDTPAAVVQAPKQYQPLERHVRPCSDGDRDAEHTDAVAKVADQIRPGLRHRQICFRRPHR